MVAGTAAAGQQAAVAMEPNRFVSVLLAAVSEWCLIAILLVDAVLSYTAARFARACRLPPPCLFCSRLDHVLGGEGRGFYRHILCHSHKIEVSSLIYCHAHRRLASYRNMCEACLLSSSSSSSSAPGKPKLPIFNAAETEHLGDVTLLYGGGDLGQAFGGSCSCCAEQFTLRRDVLRSKKKKIVKVDGAGVNGAQDERRTQLRKKQGKNSELPWMHAFDLTSHVGYSELKITSESESEMPFDDNEDDGYDENEDGYSPMHGVMDVAESCSASAKLPVDDLLIETLSHSNAVSSTPSSSDSETKPVAAQGLEEINWNIVDADVKSVHSTEGTIEQVPQQAANDPPATARARALEQSDGLRSALARKGLMTSPRFSELVGGKASEEFKLRLSQKSFRSMDFPWNSDIVSSPRLGELDASCSAGLQSIAKRLERDNWCLEGHDAACIVADVEDETSAERLRQQIEQDRKTMAALYMELEEERSASAVAANEAMAMINRLQEEKAGMQMEALQCLRMMEEQAEYDQEAIHKLNNLLTDREKELLDLEAELESCRKRLGEETTEPEDKRQISARLKNLQEKIDNDGCCGSVQDEV